MPDIIACEFLIHLIGFLLCPHFFILFPPYQHFHRPRCLSNNEFTPLRLTFLSLLSQDFLHMNHEPYICKSCIRFIDVKITPGVDRGRWFQSRFKPVHVQIQFWLRNPGLEWHWCWCRPALVCCKWGGNNISKEPSKATAKICHQPTTGFSHCGPRR